MTLKRPKRLNGAKRLNDWNANGFLAAYYVELDPAHGELVERLELATAWVKGISTDSQEISKRLDDRGLWWELDNY